MKKLDKKDYMVIDEFGSDICKQVRIYEDENGKIHVFNEFDSEITKIVDVIKKSECVDKEEI
jgi:hypothetical protein